jgi:hypothetical protein
MIFYFYFVMCVHFWAWDWYLLVPNFDPMQRVFLTIFITLFLLMDLVAIYEFCKKKNK